MEAAAGGGGGGGGAGQAPWMAWQAHEARGGETRDFKKTQACARCMRASSWTGPCCTCPFDAGPSCQVVMGHACKPCAVAHGILACLALSGTATGGGAWQCAVPHGVIADLLHRHDAHMAAS